MPYAPTPVSARVTPSAPDAAGATRLVLVLIVLASLARLALASVTGLGIDEAYMAGVSRQFALSYLDHPPLHVWLAAAMARLTGSEAPVILRLPFIAAFAGTTWVMYRLTAAAFGARAGVWAATALTLAPVFTLATGSWILPDGPMMLFLASGALAVFRTILAEPPASSPLRGWLIAGMCGGLAMLSKYLGAFLFVGVLLFLLTAPPYRRWLATPGPWIGAVVAALLLTPVLIWNAQNGWASFVFQGGRGLPAQFNLTWFLQDVGGQFGYLLPTIFVPLVYVLVRALRAGAGKPRTWFFACLAITPIALFSIMGTWSQVLPHWAMAGWLFVFPLLGDTFARLAETHGRLLRALAAATIVFVAGVLGILGAQSATGFLTRSGIWPKEIPDPTVELFDWHDLRTQLAARGLNTPDLVVASSDWIDAGRINYALGPTTPVLCLCREPHHFPFINPPARYAGRDVLLVGSPNLIDRNRAALAKNFNTLTPLPDLVLTRHGLPVLTLRLLRSTHLKVDTP